LFDLALAMTTRRAVDTLRGIHILTEKDDSGKKLMAARRLIEQAEKYAAAAGLSLPCDLRVDLNAATGLIHAAHEQHIEEILIGWHKKTLFERSTLGYMAEALLENAGNTLYIYRAQQPLATCRRIVVVVPELAERDAGFLHWLFRLRQIAANTGMPVICQVAEMTEQKIRQYLRKGRELRAIEFVRLQDWDPFSRFLAMLKKNDFFICVLARRGSLAAQNSLRKIPELVASDLNNNSTLLVFPRIHGPEAVRQWSQMEENLITPLREFSRVAWRRIFRLRRWIAQ
ncbi:MAG: hypothetical protein NZL89_02295, partial [Leptospiraceae bacterium]|nr:hypothetical protein [Leptospiraceae bacterium]